MSVFDDLVLELKEENLLESTVVDEPEAASADWDDDHSEQSSDLEIERGSAEDGDPSPSDKVELESLTDAAERVIADSKPAAEAAAKRDKEFFKKRALAELSSLQMVEHVLTTVEREYLKVVPSSFDDFEAKKALNSYLQALDSDEKEVQAETEFAFLQETEAWCSALGVRDKAVPVSSLRHYCENARPALSSQAMVAIARFYRNLPYSEATRAKFDFVITRLFSRTGEDHKRTCVFKRNEMLLHLNTLYSDWASVPLYTAEDDDSKIMLSALSFDDLGAEAESASTFDQLITSDFFGRVRLFKESLSVIFLAPEVTAAAVEANVRIGNAYITLLEAEREKLDARSLKSKYAELDHTTVSEATAKTLELVDLLKKGGDLPPVSFSASTHEAAVSAPSHEEKNSDRRRASKAKSSTGSGGIMSRIGASVLSVNRWVLVFAAIMIALSIGIVFWSNYAEEDISSAGVTSVDLSSVAGADVVKTAKVSSNILYVQLQPSWDALSKEKRQEVLSKLLQAGTDKGYNQVTLISKTGKTAGYASPGRMEVNMQ